MAGTHGLDLRTLDAPFGVEVRGFTWSEPDASTVAAFTRLLRRHLLIVLRGQGSPTRDAMEAFFRPWGHLVLETTDGRFHYGMFENDQTKQVYRKADTNYVAVPPDGAGELRWHNDQTYLPQIKTISGLEAIECGPDSLPTMFRDMYTAYEVLPKELRTILEWKHGTYFDPRLPSPDERPRMCEAMHPIFTPHPHSGRRALYVSDVTARIVGLDAADETALLGALREHADETAPVYTHHWLEGDFVIWDNVGLQHRRDAMPPGHRRKLRVFEGVAE